MDGTKSEPAATQVVPERVSVSRRWSWTLVLCLQNHSGFKSDSTNSQQLRFVGESSKMVGC